MKEINKGYGNLKAVFQSLCLVGVTVDYYQPQKKNKNATSSARLFDCC